MAADIAKMRHRITFQSKTQVSDGQGGWTDSWVDGDTVWAELTPRSVREKTFAERVQYLGSHKVVIRWKSGLTTDMRIKFGSRIFEIKSIDKETEERFFMFLECEENVGS